MKVDLTQVIIRDASMSDLIHIINLLRDDKLGINREIGFTDGLTIANCYIEAFNNIENNPHQQILVMTLNSEIIGILELTFIYSLTLEGGIRANIEGVRIKSSYRGQGLGTKFFEYVQDLAINKGCKLIQLTTNIDREDAKRFYENLGFKASHNGMKMLIK